MENNLIWQNATGQLTEIPLRANTPNGWYIIWWNHIFGLGITCFTVQLRVYYFYGAALGATLRPQRDVQRIFTKGDFESVEAAKQAAEDHYLNLYTDS